MGFRRRHRHLPVLDLRNWSVGRPIGESECPRNVEQPELSTVAVDPWLVATADRTGSSTNHARVVVTGLGVSHS